MVTFRQAFSKTTVQAIVVALFAVTVCGGFILKLLSADQFVLLAQLPLAWAFLKSVQAPSSS